MVMDRCWKRPRIKLRYRFLQSTRFKSLFEKKRQIIFFNIEYEEGVE